MAAVPSVTLNNGVEMPLLGFGVFQMPDAEECERSVSDAIRTGYRLIDTAASYGNEEAVGRAIKRSGVPREELFVTTKLWIQDAGDGTHQAGVRPVAAAAAAGLPGPVPDPPALRGRVRRLAGMEELYREGRVRAIGVSNFPPDRRDGPDGAQRGGAGGEPDRDPSVQPADRDPAVPAGEQRADRSPGGRSPKASTTSSSNEVLRSHRRRSTGRPWRRSILRWLTQRGDRGDPQVGPQGADGGELRRLRLRAQRRRHGGDRQRWTPKTSSFFDHRDPAMVKALSQAVRPT